MDAFLPDDMAVNPTRTAMASGETCRTERRGIRKTCMRVTGTSRAAMRNVVAFTIKRFLE